MIGYGEVLLVLGGAVLFLGPKDVPVVARVLGRVTGRAVGTVTNLRARVESMTQGAAFAEAHRDMREGLTQLNAIRDEIRSGFNPLSPGPLLQRVEPRAVSPPAQAEESLRGSPRPWAGGGAEPSFPFLPISAAALGRAPTTSSRPAGAPLCGADIMEECVAEEQLAGEALRLTSTPGALDAAFGTLQNDVESWKAPLALMHSSSSMTTIPA